MPYFLKWAQYLFLLILTAIRTVTGQRYNFFLYNKTQTKQKTKATNHFGLPSERMVILSGLICLQ